MLFSYTEGFQQTSEQLVINLQYTERIDLHIKTTEFISDDTKLTSKTRKLTVPLGMVKSLYTDLF